MGSRTWTIKDLLLVSADYLKQKEIDSPRLTAEVLLAR
ncbi:MAG: peptide chain release factor N(5)-glutamine methyltransferase, partial [Deltaproteobacteria bacterium]